MARKNFKAPNHTNRDMNPETYALRRKVIGFVYEAKELLGDSFKRVDVRITDCSEPRTLGTAKMGDCIMWIPASTLSKKNDLAVRHVVFHELAHAIFAAEHNNKCPLMAPVINDTSRKQQDAALKKIASNTGIP